MAKYHNPETGKTVEAENRKTALKAMKPKIETVKVGGTKSKVKPETAKSTVKTKAKSDDND